MANPSSPRILEFLDAVDADLVAGALRPVEDYLERFPGAEEEIRREYELLQVGAADESIAGRTHIGGRYRVVQALGRGGFGEVYLAEDEQLPRRVAVKVLHGLRALSREWRSRLVREAEATNRIEGAGHCPIYDVGFEQGVPYLVMPWIQGRSLDRLIAASSERGDGPVALPAAPDSPGGRRTSFLRLVERLARALGRAHRAGVVHRDVKPSNVLVRADGFPVLIDFGMAWLERDDDPRSRSAALGTPAYAAPEVLHDEPGRPDPRADVWGLGVVLFEGCTLRRPFAARPGSSLERSIFEDVVPRLGPPFGKDLQAVVETALAKNPEHRYPSAEALADDLRRLRRGEPVTVRAAGPLRRAWSWAAAHPGRISVAASLLVLTVFGVRWGVLESSYRGRQEVQERALADVASILDAALSATETDGANGQGLATRISTAERVKQVADQVGRESGPSPRIDRALGRIFTGSGQLLMRAMRYDAGLRDVERAQAHWRRVMATGRVRDEDRSTAAIAEVLVGDWHEFHGRYEAALEQYRRAQQTFLALHAEQPSDAGRCSQLGYGFCRIADMLSSLGRLDEAVDEFEAGLVLLERAEALEPERIDRQRHVAERTLSYTRLLQRAGTPSTRIVELLETAERRLDECVDRAGLDPRAWHERGRAALIRSSLVEQPAVQVECFAQMANDFSRAVSLDPGETRFHMSLVSGQLQRAHRLLELGEHAAAEEVIRGQQVDLQRAASQRVFSAQRQLEREVDNLLLICSLTARCAEGEPAPEVWTPAVERAASGWAEMPRVRRVALRFCEQLLDGSWPGWAGRELVPGLLQALEARGLAFVGEDSERYGRLRARLR